MFAAVSVLTTFSAPAKFWLHRQFSSAQFSEEMMVMVSFGATAASFVLNSKRLTQYICNNGASAVASSIFFHGVIIPDAF